MRRQDYKQSDMFSYLSPEQRVRKDHPLRAIRTMADQALNNMSEWFGAMYAKTGWPSIPPEKLLRAQLIHTGSLMRRIKSPETAVETTG
jgi:hypothetical protein